MSVLTIPNTFVTGTTINAAPFNANFAAVAASVNSIDNTNIGVAGLFASQIIPTSAAQATFGGAQTYTVPAGLITTTTASVGTSLTVGSSIAAGTQIQSSANGIASGVAVIGMTTDLSAARSTTSGILYLGSNGSNYIDYGFSNVAAFTATGGDFYASGTVHVNGGGTTGLEVGIKNGGLKVLGGTGSPSGVFAALNGSLYLRSDGTAGGSTILYINSSGANTVGNTWTAITIP